MLAKAELDLEDSHGELYLGTPAQEKASDLTSDSGSATFWCVVL